MKQPRGRIRQAVIGGACVIIAACGAEPQAVASRTDCFKWDTDFVTLFGQIALVNVLVTFLLAFLIFGLLAGPLAGRFWFFTRPFLRILPLAVAWCLFIALVFVAGPVSLWGFGLFPYAGVDPAYATCRDVTTEYQGIRVLGATFGRGVPAVAQVQTLYLILAFGSLLGAGLAWGLSVVQANWSWRSRG